MNCATTNGGEKTRKHRRAACATFPGNAEPQLGCHGNPIQYANTEIGVPRREENRERAMNCATTNGGGRKRKHRQDACATFPGSAEPQLGCHGNPIQYANTEIGVPRVGGTRNKLRYYERGRKSQARCLCYCQNGGD
jgi:hypothetical protein